jgi:hypothetical protein
MIYRQAITTKYMGPTNHKGARIKAECRAKSMLVPWDHALGVDENCERAALRLVRALGWDENGAIVSAGTLKDGRHVYLMGGALR